jgi:hypothetical protein
VTTSAPAGERLPATSSRRTTSSLLACVARARPPAGVSRQGRGRVASRGLALEENAQEPAFGPATSSAAGRARTSRRVTAATRAASGNSSASAAPAWCAAKTPARGGDRAAPPPPSAAASAATAKALSHAAQRGEQSASGGGDRICSSGGAASHSTAGAHCTGAAPVGVGARGRRARAAQRGAINQARLGMRLHGEAGSGASERERGEKEERLCARGCRARAPARPCARLRAQGLPNRPTAARPAARARAWATRGAARTCPRRRARQRRGGAEAGDAEHSRALGRQRGHLRSRAPAVARARSARRRPPRQRRAALRQRRETAKREREAGPRAGLPSALAPRRPPARYPRGLIQ